MVQYRLNLSTLYVLRVGRNAGVALFRALISKPQDAHSLVAVVDEAQPARSSA